MLALIVKDIIFLMERIIQIRYKEQKYIQLVQLRYMMDYAYREIGHKLGTSHQGVKVVDDYLRYRLKIEIQRIKSLKISYTVDESLRELKSKLPPILPAKRLPQYFAQLLGKQVEQVGNCFLALLLNLIDYHLIYTEKQGYYVLQGLAEQVKEYHKRVCHLVRILKREVVGTDKLAEEICTTNRIDIALICQNDPDHQNRVVLEILLDSHPSLTKVGDGQYELNSRVTRSGDYRLELCYAILKQAKRPLHIDRVLQSMRLPDSCYSTLHELIADDPKQRFQRIGKTGYIALREWKICCKTLKESIVDILREAETGLSIAQIMRCLEDRKQIPISLNTVNTIITNHKHLFERHNRRVFLKNYS